MEDEELAIEKQLEQNEKDVVAEPNYLDYLAYLQEQQKPVRQE